MSENQQSQRSRPRIRLIDLAAMVVGYGLAAILFRAFWPHTGVPPALGIFAVCFYIWLGLAMSGPLLLLRQRPTPHGLPYRLRFVAVPGPCRRPKPLSCMRQEH